MFKFAFALLVLHSTSAFAVCAVNAEIGAQSVYPMSVPGATFDFDYKLDDTAKLSPVILAQAGGLHLRDTYIATKGVPPARRTASIWNQGGKWCIDPNVLLAGTRRCVRELKAPYKFQNEKGETVGVLMVSSEKLLMKQVKKPFSINAYEVDLTQPALEVTFAKGRTEFSSVQSSGRVGSTFAITGEPSANAVVKYESNAKNYVGMTATTEGASLLGQLCTPTSAADPSGETAPAPSVR